jgi:hypothetical protein
VAGEMRWAMLALRRRCREGLCAGEDAAANMLGEMGEYGGENDIPGEKGEYGGENGMLDEKGEYGGGTGPQCKC